MDRERIDRHRENVVRLPLPEARTVYRLRIDDVTMRGSLNSLPQRSGLNFAGFRALNFLMWR
jgi:hypothetical protein